MQSGADAVTVLFSGNGYKKADGSMSREDVYKIADYCRERGKKTYLEFEGVCFGSGDMASALRLGLWAQHIGISALRTSDLGLLRALRQELPETPVHLTAGCGIHSLRGVRFAADVGAARICLPPQLPKERIAYIAASSPAETEITVLSPLCACFAGECTALRLAGDARREICEKLCGSAFSMGRKHELHPFSMRGFSLADRVDDIRRCSPDALFIDGVGDSPERTASAVSILSRVMRGGKPAVSADRAELASAILSSSLSDSFFDARADIAASGA
ncbi:MAG: U32 family peptidase, partial [Oscillospiraceae bacterium]|nr:U32 family peptidase [Oscillospiraceae bacterium]